MDTRTVSSGAPVNGVFTTDLTAAPCGGPASAQAFALNATVVPAAGVFAYLTLWPDGQAQPSVSTLNAFDGVVTSNFAIVPAVSGLIDAYATNPAQVIFDLSGYFAP